MKAKGIFTLTNDKLRCAAMPLGGIGTGTISIGGDGLIIKRMKSFEYVNKLQPVEF